MKEHFKLVVRVPVENADDVRQAMGDAGAGKIGNYSYCSFSVKGTGRFLPNDAANPHIGSAGVLEQVEEERIEVLVERALAQQVVDAMKKAHPYEEVAFELYPVFTSVPS
jgi:hypothetical protein